MEIQTKVHTIFLMVGPTECGKTTFAKEVLIPKLQFEDEFKNFKANIQYLSSDDIRQELLGHEHDKYDQVMLETSEQAFHLLFEKLKMVTSFPVHAEFVVLDTTGLSEDFRYKVREIAKANHYNLEVILFDYRYREDYYASDRSKKLITNHINRLKKDVIRSITREKYANIHRVRQKNFFSPDECKINAEYQVVVKDKNDYLSTILSPDETYIIISDLHECINELKGLLLRQGYRIEENMLVLTEKVKSTKFVLAGDWIDKGKHTKETIEFLYYNQEHFLFVMGNHENFVYKYLTREISGVDHDLLDTYFDSIKILENDSELVLKFKDLYSKSKPFYRHIGKSGPSYFVTHAPCKNKYLGKLDSLSVRRQRNFRIDRTQPIEDQLSFLQAEAVNNHPYHLFGHIAAKQAFRIKNKIHIDTGCVHGNLLTAVYVTQKPVLKSHPSTNAAITEELPILFKEEKKVEFQELTDEQKQRLLHCSQNQINFISGTMAPADRNDLTNELESLYSGLEYFRQQGVQEVVLQPKYMGSRCNVYLFKELDKCFAVSRNGHKIKQMELTQVYRKLLARFSPYMEEKHVGMMLLDGELMPWRAMGEGLIEKQFNTIEKALESELNFLKHHGFEEAFQKLKTDYQESGFEKDQYHSPKDTLIEKYGGSTYQNFKNIPQISDVFVPIQEQMKALHIYKNQLELYSQEGELDYKPFSLLKLLFENGEEKIPKWKTSEMFKFVSDEDFLSLDLTQSDWYTKAEAYFSLLTTEKQMEGVVIKPEMAVESMIPFMKVRNPEYLSIIYGYDYRFPHKYQKLMKQKNINKKLQKSLKEYQLGQQMLAIPFKSIHPDHESYKKVVSQFLFEVSTEREIDPRL